MAQALPTVHCQVYSQAEPDDRGRVFDGDPVAPRDAAEATVEQLAHGGCGVVEEGYDTKVKIGEALEAVGDQPVEKADAAAIRAAETRAVGPGVAVPGGVAERAQAAARGEDKVTIADILRWEATAKLRTDKAVTGDDAAAAFEAAEAEDPCASTKPSGVCAVLAAAAKHNKEDSSYK